MLRDSILIVLYTLGRINIELLRSELVKRWQFVDWDVLVETILEMEKEGSVIRHSGVMAMREYTISPEVVMSLRELCEKRKNAKFKLLDGRNIYTLEPFDKNENNEYIAYNITTDMRVFIEENSVVVVLG